jgi:transposase
MSYEKTPDRSQVFLLPPAVEDWVRPNHPARFVDAFVEALHLPGLGFKVGHAPTGRPSYSARLLLSLFVYCYFNHVRSYREMERACVNDLGAIWLTGNEHPDHNTLWRFFRDNKEAIRKVLKQSVRVAADSQLVGMVLHAVDGTKIQAQGSCKTAIHRKDLEKALSRVEASIAEMEAALEASGDGNVDGYSLPEDLADAEARREKIRASLARLDEEDRNSQQPNEPDARIMLCDKRKVFGYNAQAVSDAKVGIIVAEDVVTQPNDYGLLASMIDTVKETVGTVAATTLADKGYSAAEDLAAAEAKGYEVLVNLPRNVDPPGDKEPFHASRFAYNPEEDCCICPLGKKLGFLATKKARRDEGRLRVYHCGGYRDCPHRWQCSSNKRGRTIELSDHHGALARQRAKQSDPGAKAKMDRRCVIAEPNFGTAKCVLGFRRWSYRSLEGNRTQWSLICTTINLLKMYDYWVKGLVVLAKAAPAGLPPRLSQALIALLAAARALQSVLRHRPPQLYPAYLTT